MVTADSIAIATVFEAKSHHFSPERADGRSQFRSVRKIAERVRQTIEISIERQMPVVVDRRPSPVTVS